MNDYFHSKAKMDYYIDKINNPSFEEMDDEDKSYIIHEVRRLAMLQRRKETPRRFYSLGEKGNEFKK